MADHLSRNDRYAKLPAWAKQELSDAQAEIDLLLGRIALLAGHQKTPLSIPLPNEPEGDFDRRYLPPESGVDIDLPNGARLNVRLDHNTVRVSEKTDTGQILVVPVTTGVINIGTIPKK